MSPPVVMVFESITLAGKYDAVNTTAAATAAASIAARRMRLRRDTGSGTDAGRSTGAAHRQHGEPENDQHPSADPQLPAVPREERFGRYHRDDALRHHRLVYGPIVVLRRDEDGVAAPRQGGPVRDRDREIGLLPALEAHLTTGIRRLESFRDVHRDTSRVRVGGEVLHGDRQI